MNLQIYNPNYIDFSTEKMFFGSGKNSQRYDVVKYPFLDNISDKMMGFDWTHNEISLINDKLDFQNLSESQKFIYKRVLQKLIFLDSIQGRGIIQTIGSIVTLPELEACLTIWQHFEISKHSRSYTEILRGVWDNPSEIFDESFEIPELVNLTKSISKYYDETFKLVREYEFSLLNQTNIKSPEFGELKKSIIKFFININILEGVRFYSGFASIWAMNYSSGVLDKTSKILKLICRDENMHLQCAQFILKQLRTNESEGFIEIYKSLKSEILEMYETAYQEEIEWITYLFSKGSYLGFNKEIAIKYMQFLFNKRLRALGLNEMFDIKENPIKWVNSYIENDSVEILPQESEVINYQTNIIENDITNEKLKNFKLF